MLRLHALGVTYGCLKKVRRYILSYGVQMLAYGPSACFTRPEMKIERVTYEVPTVNAVRGLLESVYWHPGITWYVDKIHVENEIKTYVEMHNELDGQQRNTTFLHDVCYGIEAHFESKKEHPGKVLEIFNSRLAKGRQYRQPCFGLRECEAYLRPVDGDMPISAYAGTGERDLGWMVYEIDYDHPGTPSSYIHLSMVDGVIDVAQAVRKGKVAR